MANIFYITAGLPVFKNHDQADAETNTLYITAGLPPKPEWPYETYIKLSGDATCRSFTVNQPTQKTAYDLNGYNMSVDEDADINTNAQFQFYDVDDISYDQDNSKITIGGNLILTGSNLDRIQIENLDFNVNGGTATYCKVTNSQNVGPADIDATDSTNIDGGTNSGWNFGGEIIIAVARKAFSIFKSFIFNSLLYNR